MATDGWVTNVEDFEQELADIHSLTTEIEGLLQDDTIDWEEVKEKMSELEVNIEQLREFVEAQIVAERSKDG